MMPVTKEQFTREVLERWFASNDTSLSAARPMILSDLYSRLWQNIRSSGGMRLSESGRRILSTLRYEEHQFPAVIEPNFSMMLSLDRKIACPYYLVESRTKGMIILYDDKIATMYALVGDLKTYLATVHPAK